MTRSYTPVIGLEIHVQLATATKLFCACPTGYIGVVPNSNVCPVCLGLPGTLPVPNARAVEFTLRTALALGCSVQRGTRFHRKNYFYPDLPKAYQISQYDLPLGLGGSLDVRTDGAVHRIRITRVHMEEDAGKLVHACGDGRLSGADHSLADYNRAGIPLMEIVSEPDIRTPREAREYVAELRRLVRCLDVSDGDMESGSLRVDANISVKCSDGRWGSKVEIKNMNSLRALERALDFEIVRQTAVLEKGETVFQETRHWDDVSGHTRSSRSKEEAHDYRYFPDPDLPPLFFEESWVTSIAATLPELPWMRRERYASTFGLSGDDVGVFLEDRCLAEYFDALVGAGVTPSRAANWIRTEVLRVLNEVGGGMAAFPVAAVELASLLAAVERRELSVTAAREVFDAMRKENLSFEKASRRCGIASGNLGENALKDLLQSVLEENADVVTEIRSGGDVKGKKIRFLQGLVMRKARGQANPESVLQFLEDMLRGEQ